MSYSHYRQNTPGWGTNPQFTQPLAPTFQPQPQWSGSDFYNAHAVNPDPSLYDHAWNNVRQYSGSSSELGVGVHEAKVHHKRAYGGLGDLNELSRFPENLGHAAAYEAYRTWIHNSSMYEPLSGDMERQREGLIGLAVAEASRLLQFTNRSMDPYARTSASDAAAATASILFQRKYREREEGEYHRSRSRTRRGSIGSYDEQYASDNFLTLPSGHRSRSRQRSLSPMMYPSSQLPGSTAPMGASSVFSTGPTYPTGTPYPSQSQLPPYNQSSPYLGQYGSVPNQAYGSLSNNYAMPVAQSYSVPALVPAGTRQRSVSMSVPGYGVAQPQVQYAGAVPVQYVHARQPQTIIVGSGHRKHHHHHHSKKSKRSRSIDYPRHSRY
ncbi:hypothetical protein HMN09_01039000 [Mycena chlorophos]|uniref:Uncharacterized protein n=2 Tax=Mycena chlorophos TaxID=658473 RepID=A0A146ICY2_MYCCL|nr:hypothetical protein HMN09_01039000 [Mycena chlorophos]GAT57715.1 predicted protein [Mycena chlorophos]